MVLDALGGVVIGFLDDGLGRGTSGTLRWRRRAGFCGTSHVGRCVDGCGKVGRIESRKAGAFSRPTRAFS